MNKDEMQKVGELLAYLESVDGQLSNLKKRVPLAIKELEGRVKAQDKDAQKGFPHFVNTLAEMKKLSKEVDPAIKAVASMFKLAQDKKKMEALSMADFKKLFIALIKPVQKASDAAATAWITWKKNPMPDKQLVSLTATNGYCENFQRYLNDYKVLLGKMR